MPAQFDSIKASVEAALAAATKMRTTATSAATLLKQTGEIIKAEIAKAIQADDEIDNSKIGELQAIVDNVISHVTASDTELEAAMVTNVPPNNPPVPEQGDRRSGR